MKRPKHQGDFENYISNTVFHTEMNEYCDHLEAEAKESEETRKNLLIQQNNLMRSILNAESERDALKDKFNIAKDLINAKHKNIEERAKEIYGLKEAVKSQVERLLLITRLLDNNSNQLPEKFTTELSKLIKEMALSYKTPIS